MHHPTPASDLTIWRPPLNLGMDFAFKALLAAAEKARAAYTVTAADCDRVLEIYEEYFPELVRGVKRLKLEIRLVIKGVPVTEPFDSADSTELKFLTNLSEKQRLALEMMLKNAFRKVAMVLHPDRGGDAELFQQALEAYKQRDLSRLIFIWTSATNFKDPYWRQTEEALYYIATEHQSYQRSLQMLRSSMAFQVVMAHMSNDLSRARLLMERFLMEEQARLYNEYHEIINQRNDHGSAEESDEDYIEICDDDQAQSEGDSDHDQEENTGG